MSASSSPSSFFPTSSLDEESLSLPSSLSIDTTTTLNNDAAQAASSTNKKQSSTSASTSSNKRWTWTKPEGKPKRPLSSYNLFFRNCREKLVAGLPLEAALATGNATADEQLSQDLALILSELANTRAHEARLVSSGLPPPKRAHKRQHGKVSFKDMAQVVGDAWKNLDTTTRTIYDAAAAVEKKRYVAEVQRWKEKQERKIKQQGGSASTPPPPPPPTASSQAAAPKKKRAKKSKSTGTVNKKSQEDLATTATIPTSTTVNAKTIDNRNSIRNAERRRLAAIKTIAYQTQLQQQQQQQGIKKKEPFGNGMSMPSALSMMSLASPKSTSPELTHIPSSMASCLAADTTRSPAAGSSSHFLTNAIGSTTANRGGLMHQLQQHMVHPQQHGALQQPPYYVPAQLPSTVAASNTNIAAAHHNTSGTWDTDAFTSATRRLLDITETFRQPASSSTSADKCLSHAASSTLPMDIEPEPLPEATVGLDEGRLTPPPKPHAAQVQGEGTGKAAAAPTSLRRSSSLLSLSDIPLDFAEEDFKDLSSVFEEGAVGPATVSTAAVAFGAKPEAQQATFQQTTPLLNGPWEGHGQRGQQDDMSTMLPILWGGARSA